MPTVLVTGFDPFEGRSINPSWEAVSRLADEISGYKVVKLMIPTVFNKGTETVLQAVRSESPDFVFMTGVASGAESVTPEAFACNMRYARIPDNEGNQPLNQPVKPGGPLRLTPRIPIDSIVAIMKQEGYNVSVSVDAGSFVCNDVYYTVLHSLSGTSIKACFIHVPLIPELADGDDPSMPLDTITKTLHRFIELSIQKQ